MSMSDEERRIVEQAWNDLLAKNPTDGFTRKELLEHLKSSYGLEIKPGTLQVYLQEAYTAIQPKLAILPRSSPHRYIKGAEMTTKDPSQLKGGGVGGNGLKDLPALSNKDRIGILNIYRRMLTFHGFETEAKKDGCDFRFKNEDLESEAANQPEKFNERFAKFEAAMEKYGLKELFDACSELRNLAREKFRSLVRGKGKEKAEALRTMITDKEKMENFRRAQGEGLKKVMALLADLRQTVAEDERKQQERKKPPAPPNLNELDQFLGQPAAGGQTEEPSSPPIPTPGPAPTGPAGEQKSGSEEEETEPEGGQQEQNLADQFQETLLRQQINALTTERDNLKTQLDKSEKQVEALTEKVEKRIGELTAKVEALPKVQQPAASSSPASSTTPAVVPPTRWTRVGALGRRVQQSPVSRNIAFVLIAVLILVVFLQPSFKKWKVYNQPAKVADTAAADSSDTRSAETLKLQQELDREFEAFKSAAQQKGEAQ